MGRAIAVVVLSAGLTMGASVAADADTGFGKTDTGFGKKDTGFGKKDTGFGKTDTGFGKRSTVVNPDTGFG